MRKQLVTTVESVLSEDKQVVLLLGDIGVFGFRKSLDSYPDRAYNIGILEQSTIGAAAGLAMCGFVPVVHTIAPFIVERGTEQLKTDFCYQNLNGNFVSVGASYDYAALGSTHHCPADVAILKSMPGMEIVIPGTAAEFDALFRQGYRDGQPTYYRLSERKNSESSDVTFGKANIIKQGNEATVIAVGNLLDAVLEACADLDVTVLYYTTVAPFDSETLAANCPSGKILLCEPYYKGALAFDVAASFPDRSVITDFVGMPHKYLCNYGSAAEHDEQCGMTANKIKEKIAETDMQELAQIILDDAKRVCEDVDFSELESEKTILIAGASGLIGNYLLACLKQLKAAAPYRFRVVAVIHSKPASHLKELLDYDGAQVIMGDLTSHEFCSSLPMADYIIHAAGYGQPGKFMEDQVKTLKLNTSTTFSLFDKLNDGGKFLFISTSEVYSGSPNIPYRESDIGTTNTTHARSCYIEGKRCGEAICNAYRGKGVLAKSARLALAYGPGTKKGDARVLNALIAKGLQGSVNLLDAGRAKRTYCYVTDAVEIMWNILFGGEDPVYNVGGVSKTTIRELALEIGNYLDVPVVFPEEAPQQESKQTQGAPGDVCLDMTKTADEFSKNNYIGLSEGLKRTIEWQKKLYSTKP